MIKFSLQCNCKLIGFQASCLTQTVNKILNGLTRCNIYQRQEEIEALTIDTEEDLLEVFKLIYEKVLFSFLFLNQLLLSLSFFSPFRLLLLMTWTCPCWLEFALLCRKRQFHLLQTQLKQNISARCYWLK